MENALYEIASKANLATSDLDPITFNRAKFLKFLIQLFDCCIVRQVPHIYGMTFSCEKYMQKLKYVTLYRENTSTCRHET